ncbi:MAG: SDR family NAD(P)-dependent oxidoreductase [Burkholderiales bacterium]
MHDELRAKVALITGAARGIGASIAERFAAHGATVYRADVDAGADLRLDVTDRAALRAAVERIARERGGIDVLVNNAGVLAAGPFDQTSGEAWDRLVAVNLTGVFNCVQAAVPAMRGRAGASIINIASVAAEKGGGVVGNVWYGATKAGVVAITKGLGRDLGPEGIRVNAIAPGFVETDLVRGQLTPQMRERILARFPLGRFAATVDVARVAVFLASDAASFITGETIAVDGGFLRT